MFDGCKDKSIEMVENWLKRTKDSFNSVELVNTLNDNVMRDKKVFLIFELPFIYLTNQINKKLKPWLDKLYFSRNLKIRAMKYALDNNFNYLFVKKIIIRIFYQLKS